MYDDIVSLYRLTDRIAKDGMEITIEGNDGNNWTGYKSRYRSILTSLKKYQFYPQSSNCITSVI